MYLQKDKVHINIVARYCISLKMIKNKLYIGNPGYRILNVYKDKIYSCPYVVFYVYEIHIHLLCRYV